MEIKLKTNDWSLIIAYRETVSDFFSTSVQIDGLELIKNYEIRDGISSLVHTAIRKGLKLNPLPDGHCAVFCITIRKFRIENLDQLFELVKGAAQLIPNME